MKKKLFLLDALAILYRAHFAFAKNPRKTSKGFNTSAIFGFTNTLLDIITKEDPTHLAVAFDTSAPTFRHIEYEQYKAHREETPEDLSAAIPYAYKMLEALEIPALKKDGFEADDIIGTLATTLPEGEYDVYMVTPDKDYAQLVKSNVFLYRPSTKETGYDVYDRAKVIEKFGIPPERIVDYLGLMGDAVDNIPGIPKVGEKTALSLILEFGSVEDIIANADKITKNAIRQSVQENADKGLLSKHLATIKTDMDLSEYDLEKFKLTPANMEKLLPLLVELEFRTLSNKLMNSRFNPVGPATQMDLFGNPVGGYVPQQNLKKSETTAEESLQNFPSLFTTADTYPHEYQLIEGEEACKQLLEKLLQTEAVAFDTETTSLDVLSAELVGMSFSMESGKAFYLPVPANFEKAKEICELFLPFWNHQNIIKIGQNLKYDMQVLRNYGILVQGKLFDTMLAHYVIYPEGKHGMDDMARNLLQYDPISITTLIGKKGKNQLSMRDVPLELIKEYAAEDADVTFRLYELLKEKVKGNFIFEQVEMPLMPVLADMEYEGIKIDKQALNDYSKDLEVRLDELEKEIHKQAGMKFNINSPAQLGEIMFDHLKLGKGKKTKTGQYSTDEEVLLELAAKHEFPVIVLRYRGLKKLKSTYVDALPLLINEKTGRVHTTFSQSVAVTGRLASVNPNLQNIPIKTDDGKEVRKGFIPRNSEHILVSADYSQVELRIMAAFSQDKDMIAAFNHHIDIHRTTASKVFGVPMEEVTSEMRSKAKMVNFGIIYGISAFGLSQRLHVSRSEAKEIIDNYFKEYPTVKAFMDKCIEDARATGYVQTHSGRRRHLNDIHSQNATVRGFAERNAINSPIQGTAADIVKLAMIQVHRAFQAAKLQSKMVLQVHDELVFDVLRSELEQVKEIVRQEMENAIQLGVKMEVEVGTGENWLEAH
ncbi:MAG: DNA polymerase I [Bacteroidia bacterium]